MTTDTATLRQFIMLFFNDDELEDLCANYFADVAQEFTIGMTKSQKVRLLIGHVDRRGQREHLLVALAKERPAHYTEQLGRAPKLVAPPPTALAHDPRRVFISHAHQDAATARRLAADLAAAGRPVWIAPDSILPGEQWVDAIGRGLEMSGVFVLLLSPAAVASHWVRYETSLAIVLEKRGRMDILPLDWQPCEPPLTWQGYQYLPFRHYGNGLAALLARLDGRTVPPTPTRLLVEVISPSPPLPNPPAPLPNRRIHEKTGIELIRVPAGPFLYEHRKVDYPEYWIGRKPVTKAQFASFVQTTGYRTASEHEGKGQVYSEGRRRWVKGANWRHPHGRWSSLNSKDSDPATQITVEDAEAYCDWAGLTLPTVERHRKAEQNVDRLSSPPSDGPYDLVYPLGADHEFTAPWDGSGLTLIDRRGTMRVGGPYSFRQSNVGFRVVELSPDSGS